MDEVDAQFLPASLANLRRTSTGSLTRKRSSTTSSRDYTSSSSYREYTARKNLITGGSWDDNSVGHGSVAARMRRERNKAVQRTQSNVTYTNLQKDTQACITSTLNLINTTSLSPWSQHEKLPWDEGYDATPDPHTQSAAARRTAGSLCNISSTMAPHTWDSRSIPECSRAATRQQSNGRHWFTSANHHHSSPTSGCASIASSDIDSNDLAFFSMNDDSSLFDGESLFSDSLFSDSYGMMDTDSGFSPNIFSLLEEGSISCRTPFLNGDWPDSISELDFDCREQQQDDISNCDAHSDIGPSCSMPTDRNKLKKRQVRPKSKSPDAENPDQFMQTCEPGLSVFLDNSSNDRMHLDTPTTVPSDDLMCFVTNSSQTASALSGTDCLSGAQHDAPTCSQKNSSHLTLTLPLAEDPMLFSAKDDDAKTVLSDEPGTPIVESDMVAAPSKPFTVRAEAASCSSTCRTSYPTDQTRKFAQTNLDAPVQVQLQVDSPHKKATARNSHSSKVPIILSINNWNGMPQEERLGFIEQLSERINKTMGLQDQLKIVNIIGAGFRTPAVSFDDIDSHKLSRELQQLHERSPALPENTPSPSKSDDDPTGTTMQENCANGSGLRRSNSDGNIPKTLSDTPKEHRRPQRQARKWAKLLKQRQRKENRQQLKEHKSGLFVNEKKVKIEAELSEGEVDVTDV